MSQRILKNNTLSPVVIDDVGQTVPAAGNLTINPTDYGKYEGSSDVIGFIGNLTLTVNDGTFDLSVSDGVRLIQGGFYLPLSDGADPTIKASVIHGLTKNHLAVSGFANIENFPAVQGVSGTVGRNWNLNGANDSVSVSGHVSVDNFPAVQAGPISDGDDPSVTAKVTSATGTSQYNRRLYTESVLAGLDSAAAFRRVQTKIRSDGLTALATDSTVVVESTFGYDQQPDSFFRILNTGAAGDTWTIYIAATSGDSTSPDRDLPSYTKVFTIVAGEVGDEIKLRDRIIQELNADPAFRDTCFLRAGSATDRAIVHIQSTKISLSGDIYERPMVGDFSVTVTGSAVRVVGYDNLISRSKPVTIARDINSPHRFGLLSVTGQVSVTQKELADIFVAEALNAGSASMLVNGSVTPVNFRVEAAALTDTYIEYMIFDGQANGIKFGQFLALNVNLTNGLLITIKSDNIITTLPVIKSTEDFKNKFSSLSGDAANFRVDVQAGRDEMIAILKFNNPFLLRTAGSFSTDDYIEVRVRDNLTTLQRVTCRVKGFKKVP